MLHTFNGVRMVITGIFIFINERSRKWNGLYSPFTSPFIMPCFRKTCRICDFFFPQLLIYKSVPAKNSKHFIKKIQKHSFVSIQGRKHYMYGCSVLRLVLLAKNSNNHRFYLHRLSESERLLYVLMEQYFTFLRVC